MTQNEKKPICIEKDDKAVRDGCLRRPKHPLLSLLKKPFRFRSLFSISIVAILILLTTKIAISIGNPIEVLSYIFIMTNISFVFGTTIFPFWYVLKTANYFKGVFYCWFIGWTSLIFVSIILQGVLVDTKPELGEIIELFFPDQIAIGPIFAFGWVTALFWCGIAYGLRFIFVYFRNKETMRK